MAGVVKYRPLAWTSLQVYVPDLRCQLYLLLKLVRASTYQTIIDHTMKLFRRAIRDPVGYPVQVPLE